MCPVKCLISVYDSTQDFMILDFFSFLGFKIERFEKKVYLLTSNIWNYFYIKKKQLIAFLVDFILSQ